MTSCCIIFSSFSAARRQVFFFLLRWWIRSSLPALYVLSFHFEATHNKVPLRLTPLYHVPPWRQQRDFQRAGSVAAVDQHSLIGFLLTHSRVATRTSSSVWVYLLKDREFSQHMAHLHGFERCLQKGWEQISARKMNRLWVRGRLLHEFSLRSTSEGEAPYRDVTHAAGVYTKTVPSSGFTLKRHFQPVVASLFQRQAQYFKTC